MVDITEISAIVAAAGVLVGVVLTVMQVRDLVKTRHTDVIMRSYAIFESMEFQRAFQQVIGLEFEDYEDFMKKHAGDYELRATLWAVGIFFEGIGVLAKRGLIKMDLVDDLFSTPISLSWEKTAPIVKGSRERWKAPSLGEWHEYLYNEMKRREQQASKTA